MPRLSFTKAIVAGLAAICASATAQSVPPNPPAELLKVDAEVAKLAPQRPGVVDAFVLVISLDDDPVFGREAREAARVLSRRFDAAGRTLLLSQGEGNATGDPAGSPATLDRALSGIASHMDRREDVLVLYATTHGRPANGLIYKARGTAADTITPYRLATMLNGLNVPNRLVILQACYSGQFIPSLASDRTVVITAAAHDRASFGCTPGNDWTFFGHAFVNQALRKPAPLAQQFHDARNLIGRWERKAGLQPSQPQISIGRNTSLWLQPLEARAPRTATAPTGQPPEELAN